MYERRGDVAGRDGALSRRSPSPLLTITKSKGLEYDLVILLGLDDDQWWSFKNNPEEGHSTFFVAASRARERLFMTIRQGQRTTKINEIYELLKQAGVGGVRSEDWAQSARPVP